MLSEVIMPELLAYWLNIMYWENNSSFLKGKIYNFGFLWLIGLFDPF